MLKKVFNKLLKYCTSVSVGTIVVGAYVMKNMFHGSETFS